MPYSIAFLSTCFGVVLPTVDVVTDWMFVGKLIAQKIHVPAPKDILAARLGKVPNFCPSKDFDI